MRDIQSDLSDETAVAAAGTTVFFLHRSKRRFVRGRYPVAAGFVLTADSVEKARAAVSGLDNAGNVAAFLIVVGRKHLSHARFRAESLTVAAKTDTSVLPTVGLGFVGIEHAVAVARVKHVGEAVYEVLVRVLSFVVVPVGIARSVGLSCDKVEVDGFVGRFGSLRLERVYERSVERIVEVGNRNVHVCAAADQAKSGNGRDRFVIILANERIVHEEVVPVLVARNAEFDSGSVVTLGEYVVEVRQNSGVVHTPAGTIRSNDKRSVVNTRDESHILSVVVKAARSVRNHKTGVVFREVVSGFVRVEHALYVVLLAYGLMLIKEGVTGKFSRIALAVDERPTRACDIGVRYILVTFVSFAVKFDFAAEVSGGYETGKLDFPAVDNHVIGVNVGHVLDFDYVHAVVEVFVSFIERGKRTCVLCSGRHIANGHRYFGRVDILVKREFVVAYGLGYRFNGKVKAARTLVDVRNGNRVISSRRGSERIRAAADARRNRRAVGRNNVYVADFLSCGHGDGEFNRSVHDYGAVLADSLAELFDFYYFAVERNGRRTYNRRNLTQIGRASEVSERSVLVGVAADKDTETGFVVGRKRLGIILAGNYAVLFGNDEFVIEEYVITIVDTSDAELES